MTLVLVASDHCSAVTAFVHPYSARVDAEVGAPARARKPPRLSRGLELRRPLRPSGAVEVRHRVLDAPPRILDGAARPVRRARERPHNGAPAVADAAARFGEDAREPRDPLRAASAVGVEGYGHEIDPRRGIGDDGVRASIRQRAQYLRRVSLDDAPPRVAREHVGGCCC